MSKFLARETRAYIRFQGRPVINLTTRQTYTAVINSGEESLFELDSDVSPGDVLEEQFTSGVLIVADVRVDQAARHANLFPAHKKCIITRRDTSNPSPFGRSTQPDRVIGRDIPIIFAEGCSKAVVPAGYDIENGDILEIDGNQFRIQVTHSDWPGLAELRLERVAIPPTP